MRASLPLCVALAIGCSPAGGMRNQAAGRPEPGAGDEVMRDDTPAQHGTIVSVTLDANPEVHVGHPEELGLHVRLTNTSDEPVSVDDLAARLRIDDLPPVSLDLHGHGWTTLAPGESAEWDERNLGVRLFDEPGDHQLRLEIEHTVSPPVDVHVSE